MRIAYVLDSWPRLSETFVVREIAAVAQRHDVRVLALTKGDEMPASPEAASLAPRVRFLDDPRAVDGWARTMGRALLRPRRDGAALLAAARGRSESTLRRLPALLAVAAEWRAWGVDRIHAHFSRWATAAAEVLSAATGAPFGFTAHAYDVFVEPVRLAEKIARASWAVACTEAAKAEIERRCGPDAAARVRVVRHGVDLDDYRPRPDGEPRAPGPLRVLAVGRLVEKKGFDTLLDALAALHARGIAFEARIVGDGPDSGTLRSQAERLRLLGDASGLSLVGAMSPGDVRDAMRTWAHVLVAPSRATSDGDRDGIPNVVGEALACGVPVVATDVGGLPEIVVDGVDGIVVAQADGARLADAIARLAHDEALRRRFAARARAIACERFDAEKNVAELLRIVEAGRVDA